MSYFSAPRLSLRFIPVWRRNALVWRKLWLPSILGNLADPLIYMVGLGYGLGMLVGEVGGVSYIAFLAAGTLCFSTMNTASFEALYSGFSRMHVQKTWESILNTPTTLDDVLLGELCWAATKSLISGLAILAVVWAFGLTHSPLALWVIPVVVLLGLCMTAIGYICTALAPNYDFFMYYFTLFVTPMALLSGVFFPPEQLPALAQAVAAWLPLTHAVELARPLLLGRVPNGIVLHVAALVFYGVLAFWIAVGLTRRRLLK